MTDYLLFFILVLGINLLPAFGPPTWSIIVLYGLNSHLRLPMLVALGAIAAASGRFLLAHAFRHFAGRFPEKTRDNLAAARRVLEQRKRNGVIALALFAISPLPSAQLFEAAGLTRVNLTGFTAAFFGGRLLSYSIYAYSARGIGQSSLGEAFRRELTSPLAIAVQLAMIGLLVLLARFDWAGWLARRGVAGKA